jgi:ATP-binding cassette subfamily B protein
MSRLTELAWPAAELHRALDGAARSQRYAAGSRELAPPPAGLGRTETAEWLEAAAQWLGLEAEPVQVEYVDLERFLRRASPAILRLPGDGDALYLVVISSGRRLELLTPDQRRHRLPVEQVRDALASQLEEPLTPPIDAQLEEAGVKPRRRDAARTAILRARLQRARILGCWLLRLPAGASFWRQLKDQKVPRLAATALSTHLVQQLLLIGSWWMLGRGVLAGRVDPGWLLAWALLLISITPFRASELWSLGVLTTRVGALLKRRLLAGALKLEPEETRHQGVGQFLGRVIDAEAVETLVLSGGHLGIIAVLQLLLALPILALGAGGGWLAPLLLLWVGLAAWLGRRYYKERRQWTRDRLNVTHDLVESLVGHRTRLAQQRPEMWHETEDRQLADYLGSSRSMDRDAARLRSLIPRGWLLLGMLGLAPAFIAGGASIAGLAIGVGGVLFAYQAFWKLSRGLSDLAQALIAWEQVKPLFTAAARDEAPMPPELAGDPSRRYTEEPGRRRADQPMVEARELSFGYPGRARPVLTSCDLEIAAGDRLLVEGPSGSGKSTLASLVAGLRKPDSGLLLLDGFDRGSLGARGWRRRVAAAPQFHENWVLSETLMFNLLMGRGWPPNGEEMEEAEEVCRALGLGDLLDRMPSGLQQIVGESGWQLSHGEQSRLFIARALLQKTELVLFDESFAALDPANLRKCLETVIERSPTLMVVAHP